MATTTMPRIRLSRATMAYQGLGRLDITAKSARGWAKLLAPSWSVVTQYKQGSMSNAFYTLYYLRILEIAFKTNPLITTAGDGMLQRLAQANDNQLVFVCFCPDGTETFCHTHLLVEWIIMHYPDLFEDCRNDKPDCCVVF